MGDFTPRKSQKQNLPRYFASKKEEDQKPGRMTWNNGREPRGVEMPWWDSAAWINKTAAKLEISERHNISLVVVTVQEEEKTCSGLSWPLYHTTLIYPTFSPQWTHCQNNSKYISVLPPPHTPHFSTIAIELYNLAPLDRFRMAAATYIIVSEKF